jgi:hypothetical protein
MYKFKITSKHRSAAKKLGVTIKESTSGYKKLDVFKKNRLIARIGDRRYSDYVTYLREEKAGMLPPGYASKRRRLYRIRHDGEQYNIASPGYYAYYILW